MRIGSHRLNRMDRSRWSPFFRRLMALAEFKGDETPTAVARKLGKSKTTVWNWAHRKTIPSRKTVELIARVYDGDAKDLWLRATMPESGEHEEGNRPKVAPRAPKKRKPHQRLRDTL